MHTEQKYRIDAVGPTKAFINGSTLVISGYDSKKHLTYDKITLPSDYTGIIAIDYDTHTEIRVRLRG